MRRDVLPIGLFFTAAIVFAWAWLRAPASAIWPAPARRAPALRPFAKRAALGSRDRKAVARTVISGASTDWRVALTFDDGPHPQYTEQLLRTLARYHVQATLFVNGYWFDPGRPHSRLSRKVLMRAHRAGHQIGNHTYGHRKLSDLPADAQTWEIVANELLIREITGVRPTLFRAPYGQMTAHARKTLADYGYVEARWNAATANEERLDAPAIANEVLRWIYRHRGGVVLLHDRLKQSVQAVSIILAELRRTNCRRLRQNAPVFQTVALDELAKIRSNSWVDLASDRAERRQHIRRLRRVCTQSRNRPRLRGASPMRLASKAN